ncbi:DUF5994 family protein [Nocardia albiluteola]|uniref:DUF5994 family protein n=1 Tax=Nocardia albiluteola TaxID=2842303 RepID=UPI001FD98FDC|nr:DUF5994 family protein [Nocardia albiluteola]
MIARPRRSRSLDSTPPGRFRPGSERGALLRRPDAGSGLVDGAWWPRTANLTSELHDLIILAVCATGV